MGQYSEMTRNKEDSVTPIHNSVDAKGCALPIVSMVRM